MVAERIDDQLKSKDGSRLLSELGRHFCDGCRKRLEEEAVPGKADLPELAAQKLMLKAAGTKRSIPAAPRWKLDAELKPKLELEFHVYVRHLLGNCKSLREIFETTPLLPIRMPDGSEKMLSMAEVGLSTLWSHLSADELFMRRYMAAYEPYAGRVPMIEFRARILKLCVDNKVASPVDALSLLDKLSAEYAEAWAN